MYEYSSFQLSTLATPLGERKIEKCSNISAIHSVLKISDKEHVRMWEEGG